MVGQSSASSQAATRTAAVTRGVVLSTVSATGTLQPSTELSVGFTTSGVLSSVNVEAGQHVRRGQLLGRIDSLSAQQSAEQAEASLASAQAQYEQTLTGETAAQRGRTPLASRRRVRDRDGQGVALSAAKKSVALDKRMSRRASPRRSSSSKVDQGQLKVDLSQARRRTPRR